MSKFANTQVFNNSNSFVHGWYWALPSHELKRGQVKGLEFLGRQIALYRGASGSVYALDAYCPHMGAHFKEGKVEGDSIRCGFHNWKFSSAGECVEIPCQKYQDRTSSIPRVGSFRVAEKYGFIWIHTGAEAEDPIPYFSELGPDAEVEFLVGQRTYRPCRPEVVMLNAIDAHHFNAVHPEASILAEGMDLHAEPQGRQMIRLRNRTGLPDNWLGKIFSPLYRKTGILTYFNDYWYASTGVVTLGPDFLHFYLLFPHRPTMQGGTEGHMVFLTRKRKGLLGKLVSRAILWVSYFVGTYFEKGDRLIFESIKFSMKAPVKADHAIIGFIRHTENQPTSPLPWGSDCPVRGLRRSEELKSKELKKPDVVALAALGEGSEK